MKLIFDATNSNETTSLHLQIRGISIDVIDISGTKFAVIDDSSKISVEFFYSQDIFSTVATSDTTTDSIPEEDQKKESKSFDEEFEKAPLITANTEVVVVSDISSNILFQKLVALRRDIAKETNMPPYIIFHDSTLKDMVSKLPVDLESMKVVSGVGKSKMEKYGLAFIDVIKEYLAKSA
jgi:ATP-dependent DNA helicase RecQ